MALPAGTWLGPYEVLAALGAGGMGRVYRARDTRLGRDVALKVLPETFASDPERLARFEREARTLALLNHPHVAQVYGFEERGDVRALVMPAATSAGATRQVSRARCFGGADHEETADSRSDPLLTCQ